MAAWQLRSIANGRKSGSPHETENKASLRIELFLELETLPSPLPEYLINELKNIQSEVKTAERKLKSPEQIIRYWKNGFISGKCR